MKTMYERVKSELQEKYDLVFVDYRDEVSAKIVTECLENKSLEPLFEADYYGEARREAAYDELDRLGESLYSEDEWFIFKTESDFYEELLWLIEERDSSCPERSCWSQTQIDGRVMLFSNYDCWVPPYDAGALYAQKDYLETAMRVLCLNPKKVKEVCSEWADCKGRWPNYPFRNGKEVISYEGFSRILRESCNYGLLCFVGKMNMGELWEHIGDTNELVIPKGTTVTMFNHWNGGGSMADCETIRDISLEEMNRRAKQGNGTEYDFVELEVDEKGCCRGYSTGEVYGGSLSSNDLF